jgi:hypothetical protein
MTATAVKATCNSFLRSGRAARRQGNRWNRSISASFRPLDVIHTCIKDCVLIDDG